MKAMISVVIPVYNVEKYLERCLDSIFSQNEDACFEVIAVNDGSTDGSPSILSKYRMRYDNLIVVDHGVNRSLAVARRTGIESAKGDYIVHVDSDDWVNPGMLSGLSQLAKEEGCPDVVVYNYVRSDGVNELKGDLGIKGVLRIHGNDKAAVQHLFLGSCFSKMVKRSLHGDMVYGSEYQNMAEDLIYATEIFIRSSSIVLIPPVYYNYLLNGGSLSEVMIPEVYINSRVFLFKMLKSIDRMYNNCELDWLAVIRGCKIDKEIIGYFVEHRFGGRKIGGDVFLEFEREYKSLFGSCDGGLDVNRLYYDGPYLVNVLAGRVGWVNAIKRVLRSTVSGMFRI